MSKSYTEEEIVVLSNSLVGKKFGEINDYKIKSYGKGSFGHIIETDIFNYEINSKSEADFLDAGIELKVTPYKINKNMTLSAKERLVLNIINYMNEYKNDFYGSHFWRKNKRIQILWYCHEDNKLKEDLKITHQKLLSLAEEDLDIFINDWNLIIDKIKKGLAHELSEADTMYLGACTKGKNATSLREQPFSEIKAMQRAFCLKTSYMTQMVRKYIGDYTNVEKLLTDNTIPFMDYVNNVVDKYKGKTCTELGKELNVITKAKSINNILISRMFNIQGKINNTDEFLKANIIPRTIRVESNGRIKESMPFPTFKYTEIVNQDWEESELKNILETTKYMFFVFKKNDKLDDYVFEGIKLWNMPFNTIETDVRNVWEKTKEVVKSGNIVNSIDTNGKRKTNFPGQKENKVCHVRPHAINSSDTYLLPVKDKVTGEEKYTKHCFWINNTYLEVILA